jgi:hypothetical protein
MYIISNLRAIALLAPSPSGSSYPHGSYGILVYKFSYWYYYYFRVTVEKSENCNRHATTVPGTVLPVAPERRKEYDSETRSTTGSTVFITTFK